MYGYRALIETMLNYGSEAKNTWLKNAFYYHDTAEAIGASSPGSTLTNLGLVSRYELTKDSKEVDLICKPHADLFMQNRPLIPNVDIRIKFIRASPEFSLMAEQEDPNKYIIKIVSASLIVRYIEPTSSIMVMHNKALMHGTTCKYPLHRCEVTTYCIPQGVMTHSRSVAISGQLPVRVIIGLIRNDALNGAYHLNPFEFRPYFLSHLNLIISGRSLMAMPLKPQFNDTANDSQYSRAYNTLFSGTDKGFHDCGNMISKKDYISGYTFYAFKLSEDFGDDYFGMKKEGNVQIDIHFSRAAAYTFNVVLYQEFLNILDIDKNRAIAFDYNA
jgi:hypothetical protein